MPTCTFLSFRFGPTDGVSVVARNWAHMLTKQGFTVSWVAGAFEPGWDAPGRTTVVAGLNINATAPPDPNQLESALADQDLVVVENLLSIPLNLAASQTVASLLNGRPALIHHHDPPWQRKRFAHLTELPADDPSWRHVTINDLTKKEMAERGIYAETIYNGFDPNPPTGNRLTTRRRLGIGDHSLLVAHPVRAIERKNIGQALKVTTALGGTYWLLGPAEDGYGPQLATELAAARCPVIHAPAANRADIYAAADLVAFPSTWEGFGNPPVEAALYRKPVFVGHYPVADELRGLGFHWFAPQDTEAMAERLNDPSELTPLLDHNQQVAKNELSIERMGRRLENFFVEAGWRP